MAKRILNRRQLRKDADDAARVEPVPGAEPVADTDTAPAKVKAKAKPRAKTAAKPRVSKPRPKKDPVRVRARWGVFDGGMKQVAVFDYNQRGAADAKVAALNAKKAGQYFLQIVKDQMPEAVPLEAPAN